jgi:hypothetical protein
LTGCSACNESELDLYVIGDGAEIGPHAFAHTIVGTFERDAPFEYTAVFFRMEAGGGINRVCFSP